VNLQAEPEHIEELRTIGLRALPVVRKDDRFVVGVDFAKVDALLGLEPSAPDGLLAAPALADRYLRVLAAAARFMRQLPPAHYDDLIPGMRRDQGPILLADGTPVFLPNGKPYIPHLTNFGLSRHIVGHAVKFRYIAEHPDTDKLERWDTYATFGEPEEGLAMAQLIAIVEEVADAVRRWWDATTGMQLPREIGTFDGPRTVHHVLHRSVYATTQHTRQLMTVLRDLGIDPDSPLTDDDYRGLSLPARVWD